MILATDEKICYGWRRVHTGRCKRVPKRRGDWPELGREQTGAERPHRQHSQRAAKHRRGGCSADKAPPEDAHREALDTAAPGDDEDALSRLPELITSHTKKVFSTARRDQGSSCKAARARTAPRETQPAHAALQKSPDQEGSQTGGSRGPRYKAW